MIGEGLYVYMCVKIGEIVEWLVIIMKGVINRVRNWLFMLLKVLMRLLVEFDM